MVEILLAALIFILVVMCYLSAKSSAENESFRVKAYAYYSCPPTKCQEKRVKPDDLLVINPFIWPYSGSMNPSELINTNPPQEVLQQETDHREQSS